VEDCGARVLITSSDLAPLADALIGLTPALALRLALGTQPVAGHASYDAFVAGQPDVP
jgi:long-chain acyl-CoA synthetase